MQITKSTVTATFSCKVGEATRRAIANTLRGATYEAIGSWNEDGDYVVKVDILGNLAIRTSFRDRAGYLVTTFQNTLGIKSMKVEFTYGEFPEVD